MADPCPACGEPLALEGSFCHGCGYELELAVADWQGAGADLGGEEDADYQAFLRREGLAGAEGPADAPWGKLLVALVVVCAFVIWILVRRA